MLYIADFFNADVGYLIGETDSKLFDIFDAGRFLGLSNGAIEQIMRITNSTAKRPLRPITQVSRLSFEHLLCSDDYFELIIRLREMYSISPVSGVSDHNKYDCYEEAADNAGNVADSLRIARFAATEVFFRLLDNLYPYPKTEDYLIPDE